MIILPKQLVTLASVQVMKESEEDLEQCFQISEKSLLWRSKPSLLRTWRTRWKRGSFIQHLYTRTLKPSRTENFETEWTSLAEVFPANLSLKLEVEKQLKTQGIYFPLSQKESESANLELFSSKTLKESLAARPRTENQFSNMSSEHWKSWVTEQRQEYSQRVKSAHLTRESESSSLGWPTARTSDAEGGRIETEMTSSGFKSKRHKSNQTFGAKLRDAVETHEDKNWASPVAMNDGMYVDNSPNENKRHSQGLATQAVRNWSTPRASATDSSRPNNKGGIPLSDQVKRNWATPSTMDNLPARSPEKLAEAKKKGGCKNLREEVVNPKNWGTPKEQDSRAALTDRGKHNLGEQVHGMHNGQQDPTKNNTNGKNPVSLKLNPNWVEQLMGLPTGWTDFDFSEME